MVWEFLALRIAFAPLRRSSRVEGEVVSTRSDVVAEFAGSMERASLLPRMGHDAVGGGLMILLV